MFSLVVALIFIASIFLITLVALLGTAENDTPLHGGGVDSPTLSSKHADKRSAESWKRGEAYKSDVDF